MIQVQFLTHQKRFSRKSGAVFNQHFLNPTLAVTICFSPGEAIEVEVETAEDEDHHENHEAAAAKLEEQMAALQQDLDQAEAHAWDIFF